MSELAQAPTDSSSPQTTQLNRGWLIKMLVFVVLLISFGVWGALDAFVFFPKKGEAHIRFMLYRYLARLEDQGLLQRDADVRDPAETLERLRNDRSFSETSVEYARRDWLISLSRLHDLNEITEQNQEEIARRATDPASGQRETPTMFVSPRATLGELHNELQNVNPPAPLNAYDIPLQYVFMAIGFGGALWILLTVFRSSRTIYRFDPASMRLTLPDGRSFTPQEIKDFDKRHWHKYYLYFTVEGFNGELKFDLLRYQPLEEWVESMRRARPGYDPAEDEPADKSGAEQPSAPEAEGAPADSEQSA